MHLAPERVVAQLPLLRLIRNTQWPAKLRSMIRQRWFPENAASTVRLCSTLPSNHPNSTHRASLNISTSDSPSWSVQGVNALLGSHDQAIKPLRPASRAALLLCGLRRVGVV
jgi:hypothetical protein